MTRLLQSRREPAARRRGDREGGQALVELALVLPVFLLLLLGIVQFGSVFRDYIALTDATRVGARQAAVSRSLPTGTDRVAEVEARVRKAGVNLDPTKMMVSVQITDPANPNPQDDDFNESLDTSWQTALDVTVRTTYPFKVNLFGMVFHEGTIKSRTTERIE